MESPSLILHCKSVLHRRRLDERKPPSTRFGRPVPLPVRIAASYERALKRIAVRVNSIVDETIADLSHGRAMTPAISMAIEARLRERLGPLEAADESARPLVESALKKVNRFNRIAVKNTISVNVPEFSQPIGRAWIEDGVALIKDIPKLARTRIANLIQEGALIGQRHEELAKHIALVEGMTTRRAALIARDQVLTLNARLTSDRHQQAGITRYKWRIADRSKRTRDWHEELDGQIFSYDDPPMGGGTSEDEPGNPGEGINCRCQAIPVIPLFDD